MAWREEKCNEKGDESNVVADLALGKPSSLEGRVSVLTRNLLQSGMRFSHDQPYVVR